MIHIPRIISRVPIVRGVMRLVITAYARLFKGRYFLDRRMGVRLLLDQHNAVDWQLLISGTWEQPQLQALFDLTKEQLRRRKTDAVFLDIGAHWGLYALAAHKSGLFDKIVAFEPDPTNYAQLQANLLLNDAQAGIQALQLAATDRERTFGLLLRTQRNRGATRVIAAEPGAQAACRGVSVDNLLDFTDKLLVIKIDVEGHELEAIDGLMKLLSRNRCVMQVEIRNAPEGETERRFEHLSARFAPYGLKFVRTIDTDFFFVSEEGK